MLRLSLLGAFHVTLRGHPPPQFHTNKVRALLVYLALEAGQVHERATLVGLLWPEMPEAKALNNLSKALGLLRRALQEDAQATPYLLTSRQSVHFNPDSNFWLDVAEFQDGITPRASLLQLEQAVGLYRGELLSGFSLPDAPAFEEGLLLWRERLHQQMLAALEQLATHYLEVKNHEQAQRYARRQLELDTWRESAHVQLMQALALAGDRSGALAQYETCRRLLAEELAVEPAAGTIALYESIKAGDFVPEGRVERRPIVHNLPLSPTAFIGRQQELAALDDVIHKDRSRLVTIIGPGGIGKTRFALAYAERYLIAPPVPSFPEGVYFVPLLNLNPSTESPVADQLVLAIMAAIKLPLETGAGPVVRAPKQQLLDYLRQKRLLLLLDNFDDLLTPRIGKRRDAEDLVAEVLQAARQVQMIVTCRERLGLYGERVYMLPGLALPNVKKGEPGDQDAIIHAEAMQLFIHSARRVQHDFQLQAEDWLPLARLCHFLGGMPLAMELAASWVDTLSVVDILLEMQRDLDFLSTNLLNVERRHHSMRKVLDYTWQRLPPGEQSVLASLSVFRGGFTRQAAQALAVQAPAMRAPATQAPSVTGAREFISLRLLRNLVYKSLLYYSATRDRYEMHELLRRFAADKVAQDTDSETAVRHCHSAYYCAALQAREANLTGSQQQVSLAEIEADIENVRVAWRWAVEQGDVSQLAATLGTLFHFYDMRSWFQEGEQLFREAALCLAAGPASREQAVTMARLQARAGWFTFHLGQQHESMRLLQESLSQLQWQGAEVESIFNFNYLGAIMRHLGECEKADTFLSEALRLARKYDNRYQASISLNILGQTSSLRGDYESAGQYCREGLRLKREIGDQRGMTYSLTYLGRVAGALGDYDEARRLFEESMHISESLGDQRGVAFALQNLGGTAQALGRYGEAIKLYQRGLAIFRHIGNPLGTSICLIRLAEVTTVQGDLVAARGNLQEGVQIALKTGSTPHLLSGLLAMAGFWLNSGHPEHSIACLAFVQNDPNSSPALRERAQQLEREQVKTISSGSPDDPGTSPGDDNIASFVQACLEILA